MPCFDMLKVVGNNIFPKWWLFTVMNPMVTLRKKSPQTNTRKFLKTTLSFEDSVVLKSSPFKNGKYIIPGDPNRSPNITRVETTHPNGEVFFSEQKIDSNSPVLLPPKKLDTFATPKLGRRFSCISVIKAMAKSQWAPPGVKNGGDRRCAFL